MDSRVRASPDNCQNCLRIWKRGRLDVQDKKKELAVRQHSRGTGSGPASRQTLSALEERLLALMGALPVEVQASVVLLGFNRSQSPARDDPLTVYLEITDETSHLPSPPSPQPSTSQPSNFASFAFLIHIPGTNTATSPAHTRSPFVPGRQPAAPSPAAPAPPTPAPAAPTTAGFPGRPRLRARRRRQAPTPFERVASEFTEMEETRTRLQHERDMRQLEVEHEWNKVFRALVNVTQGWLDYLSQQG